MNTQLTRNGTWKVEGKKEDTNLTLLQKLLLSCHEMTCIRLSSVAIAGRTAWNI